MDLPALRESLSASAPPDGLSASVTALWWDAKGDWTKAHEAAQMDKGPFGAWVHGYLHRKEGDSSNAAYWYERAKKPHPNYPLTQEWDEICEVLLRES